MKLLNDFFAIVACSEQAEEFTVEVELRAGHAIYAAHFPGNPITPGVCILQIAQELLGERLQRRLTLQTVHNIKYMAVIAPAEHPRITYRFSGLTVADDCCKAKIVVADGPQVFAKLSVTCRLWEPL